MWWDVETTFPRETTSAKSRPSDKFVSSCLDGARPLFSGEQSEWLWLMFGCQGNDRMGSLWGFIWAPVFTIGHLEIAKLLSLVVKKINRKNFPIVNMLLKSTVSRKVSKILTVSRKSHHAVETRLLTRCIPTIG